MSVVVSTFCSSYYSKKHILWIIYLRSLKQFFYPYIQTSLYVPLFIHSQLRLSNKMCIKKSLPARRTKFFLRSSDQRMCVL